MMRRGPLADYPIETLLAEAADERLSGVIELRSAVGGSVYLVDGDLYLAELDGQPPLEERLVAAGLLTRAQVEQYTEPGEEGVYLALALDTDESISEEQISAYLLDVTASALTYFAAAQDGEYELDPYRTHSAGILASWSPTEVFERVRRLQEEAARVESERLEVERVEAERVEAERAEAERVDAERVEAERAAAERAETELPRQAGGDGNEAEGAGAEPPMEPIEADAEREPEPRSDPEPMPPPPGAPPPPPAETAETAEARAPDDRPVDGGDDETVKPQAAPVMLVVTHDEPPGGTDPIELTPIEWRIVVMAAPGISLGDLAVRLSLAGDEVRTLVDQLVDRGLLAAVG